jgi:hypothetical protein
MIFLAEDDSTSVIHASSILQIGDVIETDLWFSISCLLPFLKIGVVKDTFQILGQADSLIDLENSFCNTMIKL